MPHPEPIPQSQVLRLIAQADPREVALFLGAGASKSSGIPLAGEMIAEWRRMMFEDRAPPGEDFDAWCRAQPWFEKDEEYSVLFERLFPNERARQKYVEPKIEAGFPSWCYLYLANMVQAGHFNVIFTTNFDDLINDALSIYLGYNPVVCAADSQVESINIATRRAKIIKLHGDYLFRRLKNTVEDLEQLDPNMEAKFREFAKQCGMVVLGYAGRDRSVMRVFAELLQDPNTFPTGLYWALRPGESPHPQVQALATGFPNRVHLFRSPDFDSFTAGLHTLLRLELPRTVLHPYDALRERFAHLVEHGRDTRALEPATQEHVREFEKQLNRPWARTGDTTRLDLLEAQLAIGRRDYRAAIESAAAYCEAKPDDPAGLTTWGDALALQAEEEQSEDAGNEAMAKWRAAMELDPHALPALNSLARFCVRRQRTADAIEACERLARLAPADTLMRRNLLHLYITNGRSADALRELDALAEREPEAADLYSMRATVYEQRGLIPEALAAARRSVDLDGANAWTRVFLANQLLRTGRPDDAEQHYRRAVEIAPDNLSYRLLLAQFFVLRGQPNRSLEHLEHALRIEPNSAEARGWLAELYAAQGRFADARREIDAALELSPADVRIVTNAGIIYARLAMHGEAEHHLREAHRLNPAVPQPLAWLAMLYWLDMREAEMNSALQHLAGVAPPFAAQLGMQLQSLAMEAFGDPGRRRALLERQWAATPTPPPVPTPTPSVVGPPPAGSLPGQLAGLHAEIQRKYEQTARDLISRMGR